MTSEPHPGAHDHRPVPDPTTLTTAALAREIAALKEIVFTRLDGMDRAIVLFNENLTRAPTEVDKQITHLRELLFAHLKTFDEKFASVARQFQERDIRTEQGSRDAKVAVDAALQAAKEAVGEQNKSSALAIAKSESATGKQLDQLALLVQQVEKGNDVKISDLKDRLSRMDGTTKGMRDLWGFIVGGAGLVVALLAIAGSVLVRGAS